MNSAREHVDVVTSNGGMGDGENRECGKVLAQTWDGPSIMWGKWGEIKCTSVLPKAGRKRAKSGDKISPEWEEKLGNWEEALKLFERTTGKAELEENTEEAISYKLGELRCHAALDNSYVVLKECKELWKRINALRIKEEAETDSSRQPTSEQQKKLQTIEKNFCEVDVLGSKAAWALGEWKDLEEYVRRDNIGSAEGGVDDATTYFSAVMHIKENDFEQAQTEIDKARKNILGVLSSMLGDFSYSRSDKCLVTVQQLSELEEIITHKKKIENLTLAGVACREESKDEEQKSMELLRKKWNKRMEWIPQTPELWRQMLTLRSLVLKPEEDLDAWIKYEKMCRRSGQLALCSSALKRLGVSDLMDYLESGSKEAVTKGSRSMSFERQSSVEEDRTSLLKVNPIHSPLKMLRKQESIAAMSFNNEDSDLDDDFVMSLPNVPDLSQVNPRVVYSIYKYNWARAKDKEAKRIALTGLKNYCGTLDERHKKSKNPKDEFSTKQLLGRCLLKVAKWKVSCHEEAKEQVPYDDIIKLQQQAAVVRRSESRRAR